MCSSRLPGDNCAMNESSIGAGADRSLAANSLWQLISVRFKEYTREPEALFWSFGFPILLAIGLGIAFRSKPADVAHVAVVNSGSRAAQLAASLQKDSALAVETVSADSAALELRTGRIAVVV